VPFRVLAANQHPDHDTTTSSKTLSRLFIQILSLCRKAGLLRLGHVALGGTKMRANASKHPRQLTCYLSVAYTPLQALLSVRLEIICGVQVQYFPDTRSFGSVD
jgi:hypothetical protein